MCIRDSLSTLVASQTGNANMVEEFSNSKIQMQRMQSNLEGQLALTNQLKYKVGDTEKRLKAKTEKSEKFESQLVKTRGLLSDAKDKVESLKEDLEAAGGTESGSSANINAPWWWLVLGSVVIGLLGSALGYSLARKDDLYDQAGSRESRDDRKDYEDTSGFGGSGKELSFDDDPHADLAQKHGAGRDENVALKIEGKQKKG